MGQAMQVWGEILFNLTYLGVVWGLWDSACWPTLWEIWRRFSESSGLP